MVHNQSFLLRSPSIHPTSFIVASLFIVAKPNFIQARSELQHSEYNIYCICGLYATKLRSSDGQLKITINRALVKCSQSVAGLGGVRLGVGLTGKLGHAWVTPGSMDVVLVWDDVIIWGIFLCSVPKPATLGLNYTAAIVFLKIREAHRFIICLRI